MRLRSHTTGPLTATSQTGRGWDGPDVPDFVPQAIETLELHLLDSADDGYLAFYRDPYNQRTCTLGGPGNCAYLARYYDRTGRAHWSIRLDKLLSRRTHLEIQDIRLAGGVLYFNEACQSYSRGAGGQCSALVAVDPKTRRVLWRSQPLVSNSRFTVRGCYLVAGYGFTAEPDAVHLVDRGTGKVLQSIPVSSAPGYRELLDDDRLDVELHSGVTRRYRLVGFDRPDGRARLESLDPDEPGFGGAAYGGLGYGGVP
jgi:hypothetical protein